MKHIIVLKCSTTRTVQTRISVRIIVGLLPRSHIVTMVLNGFLASFIAAVQASLSVSLGTTSSSQPLPSGATSQSVFLLTHRVQGSRGPSSACLYSQTILLVLQALQTFTPDFLPRRQLILSATARESESVTDGCGTGPEGVGSGEIIGGPIMQDDGWTVVSKACTRLTILASMNRDESNNR